MSETYDFDDGNGPVPAHRHSNGGGWVAETAKVDASALNHASSSTKIARVIYSINTTDPKGSVEILFDGTTNASALFLSGQGTIDLQTPAIQIANNASSPTGDILFSTHNFVANDSYTVILEVR